MKKTDFDKILRNYVLQQLKYIKEHEEIIEILTPLVGKPINHQTLNKKRMGKFELVSNYGHFNIVGDYSHLIGYKNSKESYINIEPSSEFGRGFKYLDNCHGEAAKNRINKINSVDAKNAFEIFKKIDKAYNNLKDAFNEIESNNLDSYNFPCFYEIFELIEGVEGNKSETPLYKIYQLKK